MMAQSSRSLPAWSILLLVALSLVAYTLPWLVNPGVGLTMGAYDLAEWSTLHPVVRGETPALLTSLFLRLPLVCMVVILSLSTLPRDSRTWWIGLILVVGIALFSMPPLEFFVNARGDINYQQQFVLGTSAFLLALAGYSGRIVRFRQYIIIAAVGVGVLSALLGLQRAYRLMYGFSMPLQVGFGAIGMITAFVMIAWGTSRR